MWSQWSVYEGLRVWRGSSRGEDDFILAKMKNTPNALKMDQSMSFVMLSATFNCSLSLSTPSPSPN